MDLVQDSGELRREVHDRHGHRIYLTAERWRHVLGQRPWMGDHLEGVLNTLRHGRRKQDPLDPAKYKYYLPCPELLPDYNHFVVVVIFREQTDDAGTRIPNNFVTTAWTVFIYS